MAIPAQQTWASRKDYYILLLVFVLFPLVTFAGGLGISPIVAVSGGLGLVGLHPAKAIEHVKKLPLAIWLVLFLLLWGVISTLWSPYKSDDTLNNPTKLLVGVPLFLGCAVIVREQAKQDKTLLSKILIGGMFAAGIAILIDLLTGYKLTLTAAPLADGEDPMQRAGDLIQNLGHGVTVLALLMIPVSLMLWTKGRAGKAWAIAAIALVLVCGLVSGLNSSVLAVLVSIAFVGFAAMRPLLAVRLSFALAGLALLLAPLLALIASKMTTQAKASLPFSWEERVENWNYVLHKIIEHPFIGHGFDAVRTFNDKHTIRGFEGRALVSLHPHNAGLHLWAELGLIGIGIACLALYFGARHLTQPGRLSRCQLIAVSGIVATATVISSLSYGVWQDWWWATIIFTCALIAFIRNPALST